MTFQEFEQSDIAITPGTIQQYAEQFMAPEDIDHHGASEPAVMHDLYLRKNDVSDELIRRMSNKALVSTFIDNIDHEVWYEFPLCYNERKGRN